MSLGPLQGENQGNPADRCRARFNRVEVRDRRPDGSRQLDSFDLIHLGIGAVLGWRGDQVLAAGERPLGMDRARLVFEKGAGNALAEVGQTDLARRALSQSARAGAERAVRRHRA